MLDAITNNNHGDLPVVTALGMRRNIGGLLILTRNTTNKCKIIRMRAPSRVRCHRTPVRSSMRAGGRRAALATSDARRNASMT